MKKIFIFVLLLCFSVPAYAKHEDKHKKHKTLPPGLQKKYKKTGELPPGWQKKLVKGKVLDPNLYEIARQHRLDPSDYSLKRQKGTELLRLEDRIVRIVSDTKVVLDVLGIKVD